MPYFHPGEVVSQFFVLCSSVTGVGGFHASGSFHNLSVDRDQELGTDRWYQFGTGRSMGFFTSSTEREVPTIKYSEAETASELCWSQLGGLGLDVGRASGQNGNNRAMFSTSRTK
ncbi:hypothetical protein RvY_08053 [Ramazzottius varieornatus]|uniref:Uncharacterized protein n=1 Tax=Ramazzottius varieornatus TaxID=947166 RepID=A0A1D1V4I4_RAMVA|nr:hypothetical protein RvY_08053 [Ramazzottius varieornatus]